MRNHKSLDTQNIFTIREIETNLQKLIIYDDTLKFRGVYVVEQGLWGWPVNLDFRFQKYLLYGRRGIFNNSLVVMFLLSSEESMWLNRSPQSLRLNSKSMFLCLNSYPKYLCNFLFVQNASLDLWLNACIRSWMTPFKWRFSATTYGQNVSKDSKYIHYKGDQEDYSTSSEIRGLYVKSLCNYLFARMCVSI